ncbi:MAG: PD-(D/E)XK nuclease family protein, partial [Acidimicrobiales bacterium]
VAWARRHLDALTGGERRRGSWPPSERTGAERVERALDRLAGLDAVERTVALDVFTRTITLELESDLGRVGRMGEGVLVGSVAMGVGLDLDLVVVLGLAEGLFPTTVGDDSLLPDHERRAADDLALRADQTGRHHRQLLAALAGAADHVLCVPRGDLRRNTAHVASRWVLDEASALAGRRWWSDDLMAGRAPWLEHVASFDAGLRTAAPASAQEHRLRSLMVHGSTRLPTEVFAATGDAVLEDGAVMVAARRSDRFTRFDGNLGGLDIPSPADRPTSATRLERWADCPFAYLVQSVFGVDALENPEDQLQISPRDWGSLVHESLELFMVDVLARPAGKQPAPGEGWSPLDRARLLEIGGEVCARFEARGLTGRPVLWRRDRRRILADLERFVVVDGLHRAIHGTRPVAAELAFGMPGADLGTVAIALPDGRSVQFRGLADRVDEADDGTLHVIDYKTGSARAYSALSEENPDAGGQRLQLTVYGQAARALRKSPEAAVMAEYWFVSAQGKFERKGYAVTPDVVGRVGQTIGTMVEGIESGVFPPHPTATASTPFVVCDFCDPDALGVSDLARQFENKQTDPAMAVFADLVLVPDEEDDDGSADG